MRLEAGQRDHRASDGTAVDGDVTIVGQAGRVDSQALRIFAFQKETLGLEIDNEWDRLAANHGYRTKVAILDRRELDAGRLLNPG